jgi:hypothetical protein
VCNQEINVLVIFDYIRKLAKDHKGYGSAASLEHTTHIMEGMNESYSLFLFYSHSVAEQGLSNFSHPKISLGFEFLYVFTTLDFDFNLKNSNIRIVCV